MDSAKNQRVTALQQYRAFAHLGQGEKGSIIASFCVDLPAERTGSEFVTKNCIWAVFELTDCELFRSHNPCRFIPIRSGMRAFLPRTRRSWRIKALSDWTNQRQDGPVRYEPMMRPGGEARGAELYDRVGAVMTEIAAFLDERRSREVLDAREALALAYCEASQRRRARKHGQGDEALTRQPA